MAKHMVAGGWGLAYRQYSEDYVDVEDAARSAGRGAWGSEFEAPGTGAAGYAATSSL